MYRQLLTASTAAATSIGWPDMTWISRTSPVFAITTSRATSPSMWPSSPLLDTPGENSGSSATCQAFRQPLCDLRSAPIFAQSLWLDAAAVRSHKPQAAGSVGLHAERSTPHIVVLFARWGTGDRRACCCAVFDTRLKSGYIPANRQNDAVCGRGSSLVSFFRLR